MGGMCEAAKAENNSNILSHVVGNNHLNKSLFTTLTIFVNKQMYLGKSFLLNITTF